MTAERTIGVARRYGRAVAVLAILALTAAGVTVTPKLFDAGGASVATRPQPSPSFAATATASLNPTDIAFIELMIPMNERTLPLLDLLATDPVASLREVVTALATIYPAEVRALRAALAAGGAVEQDLHAGMDMPGFVTAAQLAAVDSSTGADRETAARDALCAHLNQSLQVVRGELSAGGDATTRAIADAMVAPRRDHLAALHCQL